MRRLMEPFLESFPWWCARPWLLALLLLFSPGAFLVGRYFQAKSAQSSLRQLEGYDQILNRARATAKALGIPAAEWRATFRFVPDAEMNRFAQRERAKIPAGVRRILPVESVRVLLLEGQGKWVEFSYTGEGHLLGYAPSPGIFVSDEMLANTGSRELALSALEAVVDPSAFEFGEASAKTSDGGMGQRFEWSLRAKCCPELATTAAVEVVGRRPSSLAIHTAFQSNYLFRRGTPLNLLVEVLRIGFLIVGLLFVGFRFAKRAMEREVPYSRAGVMWGVWLMAGAIFVMLQPFGGVEGETAFIAGPFWYVGIVLRVLIFAVTGMLLALAYGATEGDLRETFPGKLTALDAALSGRVFSRNVGVSIVAGAAWGAWIYGLTQIARAWFAPGFIPLHETELQFSYSAEPWLGLVGANLFHAIRMPVTVLLVALSIGQWFGRTPGKRRWITALCSIAAVSAMESPLADAHSGLLPLSVLATLWLGLGGLDYLAAAAALSMTTGGSALADLQVVMPAWKQPAAIAWLLGAVTLLVALVTAYRGKRCEDAEVMPAYARNIEERHSRQQEVSAAREAQQRLLPEHPPNIPGLGLAAFCAPSNQGVSGDFFDFYPMSRGRLGLLMADGRSGGLGAALTIALAKGFVQYAAHRDWTVGETLRRLREVATGELNLAYAVIDPAQGQLRFARLGATPVILAGLDAENKAEALGGLVSDGLTEGAATFAAGDVLLLYTDGVPQRLAMSHHDELDAWLHNKLRLTSGVSAYRIGEALQEALRVQEGNAPDDLTAVVIRFEPAERLTVEVGA